MDVFREDMDTDLVVLVPDIVRIHPDLFPFWSRNRKMVMIALVEDENYISITLSLFFIVEKIDLVKGHFHLDFIS